MAVLGLMESLPTSVLVLGSVVVSAVLYKRFYYNIYPHPLAKYPGPWYCAVSTLPIAIISSTLQTEPEWIHGLVKKYGTDKPIRISPNMLLFPKPSSLKEIYWEPKLNQKSSLYGTGMLGAPHLFTTLDGEVHRSLRKALGGPQWSIGSLKNHWESRIDEQVQMFVQRMTERAETKEVVCLSDKVAQFAADIMTMFSFTNPWGFIKNSRDERNILTSWRQGLPIFGFAGRSKFFQNYVVHIPGLGSLLLPKTTDEGGMGYLVGQAVKAVNDREALINEKGFTGQPDFMQYAFDARRDGKPLEQFEKIAHVTLLIQAGADTTGTALGSTLRYLTMHDGARKKALEELEAADRAGKLSTPIKYEETREHLPYFVACIKEAIRLNPPATNLFARVTPKEGFTVEGHYVPGGTDITSHAYVVQRDPDLYGPDPDAFRPERWLEKKELANEMDAQSFVFGMGSRVCLGKDIATMELYKLLPETLRRFDMELVDAGKYSVVGGVAYNKNFNVKFTRRA